MKSLKDQLLKAGLTDKQSVNKTRKKNKQPQKPKAERGKLSASAQQAELRLKEKALRDKQLNKQRQLESEKKAKIAQIRQLIDSAKIEREEGDIAYRFTDQNKIRTIYVNADQQKQLANNRIAIVRNPGDVFELVPKVVAEKIVQRDASYVIAIDDAQSEPEGEDPYADYQIPDDLIW